MNKLIEKYTGKIEKIDTRLASIERRFENKEVPEHTQNMYDDLRYEKEIYKEFINKL